MNARIYHILTVLVTLIWISSTPAQAQNAASVQLLQEAISLARMDDWPAAQGKARSAGPLVEDILEWHRLRQGQGNFSDSIAFLKRRADWPGLKLLRRRTEKTIPRGSNPDQILAFFATQPPQTGRGVLRLAEAMNAKNRKAEWEVLISGWQDLSMDEDEHNAFVTRHGQTLQGYHWIRTDNMLWRGNTKDATRMLPLLTDGQAALARARIALRKKRDGVDALIKAVPATLANDPGLAYERFLWRAAKGRNQDAADLLLARSKSLKSLGQPERWGSWRRVLARWSMRDGKPKQAYQLAAQHQIAEGASYNDLEWLAGYIALRKLNDPETALYHFKRFRAGVFTPISLGRAGYWQGRALEAVGKHTEAQAAMQKGPSIKPASTASLLRKKPG